MPPVTNKPAAPKAPAKPVSKLMESAAKMSGGRPVLYPRYYVMIHCKDVGDQVYDGPITYEMMKKLLQWETEEEYAARRLAEDPKLKKGALAYGDNYLLKNYKGEKVNCWSNPKNRPFDEPRAKSYAQDILEGRWEFNCENMIIGQTGIVISAQHRGCGFMLAVEEWRATRLKGGGGHWEKNWPEEPVLESMVAFGCKEDPRVIRTIDNVKPRTLSDTIFSSPIFDSLKDINDRKECCRMMDFAIDLLWKRTKQADAWSKYQTHSSSLDFLDKHPKIKACTKHIFDNNRDRVISRLGLSPGDAAGMLYLMGSSETESEDYYYPESPKKESLLDWGNWDQALEFWSGLVDAKNERMEPVRKALAGLQDPYTGATVPGKVKHMVLAMAWNAYLTGQEIEEDDVDVTKHLLWSEKRERTLITEEPTVGGIDCGVVKGGGEEEEALPTPEEIEAEKEKEKQKGVAKMKDAVAKPKTKKEQVDEEEEAPNPLVTKKEEASKKIGPVFSEEERKALVAKMQPATNPGGRGPNNEPAPKPKAPPKKPTLAPKS